MALPDEPYLRAKLLNELRDCSPQQLFELMSERLLRLFTSRDIDTQTEIIQLTRAFITFQADPNFTEQCRAVYEIDSEDASITRLVHSWFTNYRPSREGLPHSDDQNAQVLISLPRGVQRSRARQNNRKTNEALLRSPFPDVIEILCANPSIREMDILFMASRRPTQNHLLEPIFQSHWLARPEIRLALTANPYLKTAHALRCAFTLSQEQLRLISDMNELHPILREHALELLRQYNARFSPSNNSPETF